MLTLLYEKCDLFQKSSFEQEAVFSVPRARKKKWKMQPNVWKAVSSISVPEGLLLYNVAAFQEALAPL